MKNDILDLGLGKKIQNHRLNKKFTIKELAEKIGITSSMLSQIERDLVNPSIATLRAISKALDVPLFMFFKEERSEELVVKSNSRKSIGLPESNEVRYELLTPDTKGSIEFCLMYIPNNTATEEFNQSHQGEEVAFVLKGTVEVIIEDREYILEEGDSIRIPALTEHRWVNFTDEEVKVIFAITPPSF